MKARIEELTGRKPFYIVADLTKRKDLEKSVKEVADIGDVDIFFFLTGGSKPGYFMEMEDWEKAVNLLLYLAVYLTKALLPKMIEKNGEE